MNKIKELNNMLLELYDTRRYEDVISKADQALRLDIRNQNYIRTFRFLKAKSLRYLGNFDEALIELIDLCRLEPKNSFYNIELFFTYYYVEKYKEAFDMLKKIYLLEDKNVSNYSVSIMEMVIRKNLNLPMYYNKNERGEYVKGQIAYYNETLALAHINSHTRLGENLYNTHSVFNESINLKYLFECTKQDIKNSQKINVKDALDVYCFAVPGIGYTGNNKCDYLKVIVCPGTKNIITMYPFAFVGKNDVKLLNCDLDLLFNRDKKVKSNSRIDKFNKKFNLK